MDKRKSIKELNRFFSGKNSEIGEDIFNDWFNSIDDAEGYLDNLNEEERERYKRIEFQALKKNLQLTKDKIPHKIFLSSARRRTPFYKIA
ncbi:MAG: hypothetical protein WD625_06795, partial [Balneolales bacterium]